jgi:hypothetical protein
MVKIKDLKEFSLVFLSVSSVKSVSGPMASTATFKFGLQISKSHRPTKPTERASLFC